MSLSGQYELLDFGKGRKLERFGAYIVDRPAPAAERALCALPADEWRLADARFERDDAQSGRWIIRRGPPADWAIRYGRAVFELRPAESGQVGVFPEQAGNWNWIARQVAGAHKTLNVLNRFAYTGGSTLAAAGAGASVVHVDASKSAVAWARRNAQASGLADAPIRWIVEDAPRFVRRELRRGNQYDAVILDPPSYGHGAKGEVWRLVDDLPALIAACADLTAGDCSFMLLTCHTPGFGPPELKSLLAQRLAISPTSRIAASELSILDSSGRPLDCGAVARWAKGVSGE